MTRLRGFALTLALTLMTAACTPAVTAPTDNRPIPASSGTLRLIDAAKPDQPPTLALEPTNAPVSRYPDEREDTTIYKVVVNHEEMYSIWPADRENPLGWNDVGKSGLKQECLDYIQKVWTDMRPLSLRKKMEEMERQQQQQK
jgi:MbtH protein